MNIVLAAINAKYIHSNLAVYSLRAYAQQYKDEIQIAEYTINQQIDDSPHHRTVFRKQTKRILHPAAIHQRKYFPAE